MMGQEPYPLNLYDGTGTVPLYLDHGTGTVYSVSKSFNRNCILCIYIMEQELYPLYLDHGTGIVSSVFM